ncbi:flotillin domain-containing protein [Purpureocillium lavendulum]|uniref:Flotillin domain-containing protein n=1 Tax=Purpureocillium lavendulum TaxID=1247861 RepID=A0AB34FKF1_9HYPO|nr:flotillin domain-containing protein [Purpureocillium lavendulum]
MSYRISAPDEYLAVTGMGVRTVKITKAAWVWPFQRCTRFSVQPHDYAMDLQAMTKEKLQFSLPVVFTVGPDVNARGANAGLAVAEASVHDDDPRGGHREDRGDALMKYAMLLAQSESPSNAKMDQRTHVASIVKGIIEGETRVLVSSMTMEEIFTEREVFKRRIFRNIQSELDQFGLKIYNANVKELKDAPNSVYFESLSRKAHEGATNQARIDVAEAQLKGNVGEAQRKGEQDREIAKINAETAVQKTERDIERSQAEARLNTKQTMLTRDVDIARVEAQRTLESKDEDLKKEVEIRRAAAEMERLRARDVVKATIARESKQQAADASAYEVAADARARQEATQRHADASAYTTRVDAEAANYSTQQAAEAAVVRQLKEAEGITAMAEAYGKMSTAFGGPAGLLQYMMIEKGTYVELAKANAEAVRGMAPKISVWNTGSNGGASSNNDPAEAMRNVYQMLPPLMTTINEQTGITLPEWQVGRLNAQMDAMDSGKGKVNGDK